MAPTPRPEHEPPNCRHVAISTLAGRCGNHFAIEKIFFEGVATQYLQPAVAAGLSRPLESERDAATRDALLLPYFPAVLATCAPTEFALEEKSGTGHLPLPPALPRPALAQREDAHCLIPAVSISMSARIDSGTRK